MKFEHNIPLDQIRPGDHFEAVIQSLSSGRKFPRRCTLVAVYGRILQVKVATRKSLICIWRDEICSDHAWGER
jgi:hypothetical protein